MSSLELYNIQLNFYKNPSRAWKSLNKKTKEELKNNPDFIIPITSKTTKTKKYYDDIKKNNYYIECWDNTNLNKNNILNIELREFNKFNW